MFVFLAGCATAAEPQPGAGRWASLQTPTDPGLQQVARSYSDGYLHRAWSAYVTFLLEATSRTSFADIEQCTSCPDLGGLGAQVGASRSALPELLPFCTRAAPEDKLDECRRWLEGELAFLGSRPGGNRLVTDVLPMVHYPGAPPLGGRPLVDVAWNGRTVKALVDTGNPTTILTSDSEERPAPLILRRLPNIRGELVEASLFEVSSLQLGASLLKGAKAYWRARRPSDDPQTILGANLGMDVLLRFSPVCFAWTEAVVYVGKLGPCKTGLVAHSAKLLPGGKLTLGMRAPDGMEFLASVDTGSGITFCSKRVSEMSGPDLRFEFGSGLGLFNRCWFDSTIRIGRRVGRDILIGVDTLAGYRAFGWELAPLRVFFVPADGPIAK